MSHYLKILDSRESELVEDVSFSRVVVLDPVLVDINSNCIARVFTL